MQAMGIQETLEILKQAQEVDREIFGIRHELSLIPETFRHMEHEFEGEKLRLTGLEGELKAAQLRQKQKEGELTEKESQIRKYDSQLSQVKTNKEYAALQQEIASLKADRSLLEDEILGLLDEVEKIQQAVREERNRLGQIEKEWETKKKTLTQQEASLKGNLTTLSDKRTQILTQVPTESRDLYERVVEKREGLALVHVQGEACGACRIEIRPQLLNELGLKESFVICENCSRILYLD